MPAYAASPAAFTVADEAVATCSSMLQTIIKEGDCQSYYGKNCPEECKAALSDFKSQLGGISQECVEVTDVFINFRGTESRGTDYL